MVIFHSYVSLPEGKIQLNQLAGFFPWLAMFTSGALDHFLDPHDSIDL